MIAIIAMKLKKQILTASITVFLMSTQALFAAENTDAVVSSNTAFAFDLYKQLQTYKGNLFLSPYSISTALAMTYAGAREQTAAQMSEVLHFGTDQTQFHSAFGELQAQINAAQQKEDIALNVANGLWFDQAYPFLDSFIDLVTNAYQAELKSVDFQTAFEAARLKINTWVEEQTQDKIKELIKPGMLSSLTRLVLVNAIYFKGNWATEFDKSETALFWVTPETSVEVPIMSQKEIHRPYFEDDLVQVLELAYEENEVSMIVILPKGGFSKWEQSLTAKQLEVWLNLFINKDVTVFLPKFKISGEFELSNTLSAMGMPDAFNSRQADFSGLNGTKNLVISSVIHKAFVDVNEEGTEAAASTGVGIGGTAMPEPPEIFRADHPFLFLIRHNPSGSILFLGRVVNPLDTPPQDYEATLSPDLKRHIPVVRHRNESGELVKSWADLEGFREGDKLIFELVDHGDLEVQ
ncbi:MAG TPA: serpin family protein [Thiotrichaceae bacterium]|nr:serpin family protein [Thiotrichaceae bacterium]